MINEAMKIKTIGLDERGLNTLAFFFKKYCAGRCVIVSESKADIFIINMDHHNATNDYLQLQKEHPASPIIVMALKPIESKEHYFLRKPMVADNLLAIIDDIEKSLVFRVVSKRELVAEVAEVASEVEFNVEADIPVSEKTFSGYTAELLLEKNKVDFSANTAKINFPERRDINNAKFDLNDYFLGAIFQAYKLAKESQSVVKLSGLWRPICFFPETNEVYIDLSKSQLRSVCATSIESQTDTTVVPREIKIEKTRREWELKSCHKSERFYSIESFMWKAALYTSRGRVPEFVDIKQTIVLSSWPNLTRLDLTPDALKLIAYWSASPRSLEDAVKKLGIEQRYAFSLFTAMYVLGHISSAKEMGTQYEVVAKESAVLPKNTKSLLAKVVTKLKLAW